MTLKNCQECGRELRGRIDKKFCNDMCRNAFNNRLRNTESNLVRITNRNLRKNRKILEDICPGSSKKIKKHILIDAGFNLKYLTSFRRTTKGDVYFFCYEFGYLSLDDETLLIVRRKE